MTEKSRLIDLMKDCLERKFPHYEPNHVVKAAQLSKEGEFWIGYKTNLDPFAEESTHLDINLCGDTCFLVSIGLERDKRGQGFGRNLYSAVEEFAKLAGSKSVRMTASGWTPSGKTRQDYMVGLGYTAIGNMEVQKVL
ncbi:GNAT family N-acetyltransferase [Candidatus Woesearchaeota archaeon]|jgi:GNAT superfamily N-acetyltransferase|nr:GNAT family N-acetyltransferase [Candidatus Woesearchaeota archaeon]MBT6023473.1 GNAT family N-acetyltransferase [Candidatus Woesearchaeota archaeon]MBT6044459.1 GNAT family N-acetyltransferase [Candidatus Woesearchaeota archaeon]